VSDIKIDSEEYKQLQDELDNATSRKEILDVVEKAPEGSALEDNAVLSALNTFSI